MWEVLDEHLEYLSLPGRSEIYTRAISNVVEPGDRVADLGCGIGVLGIFCLEAGAAEVWGIDRSDAIHLASEIMVKSGFEDRYHCIADSTFRVELPEPVDLIICDHVGFFGFDYGIIEMMGDARRRMLKPGGKVMPNAMDLMVAAAHSDACRSKVSAWKQEVVPEHFHWLDEYHRNARHHHSFTADELISDPAALGRIAFDEDNPEVFRFEITLKIERAGRFDGIAGWFNCELGGDVRMTNSPLDPASIQRSQAFLPVNEPFDVDAGDEVAIAIRFRHDVTMIAWTIQPPGDAPRQKLSTWNGTILTPADLVKISGEPLVLSKDGEARTFVLKQVDGTRSAEEITQIVLDQRPDLLPTELAVRDFVKKVLTQDCRV